MAGAVSPGGNPIAQPVSGPGAFSSRTDTSPGQPIRVPTGQPYGKAKQLENMQQSSHLPQIAENMGGPGKRGAPRTTPLGIPNARPTRGGMAPRQPLDKSSPDLLGLLSHPTQRPNEPVTTGKAQMGPDNTTDILRMLAAQPGASPSVKRLAAMAIGGK